MNNISYFGYGWAQLGSLQWQYDEILARGISPARTQAAAYDMQYVQGIS